MSAQRNTEAKRILIRQLLNQESSKFKNSGIKSMSLRIKSDLWIQIEELARIQLSIKERSRGWFRSLISKTQKSEIKSLTLIVLSKWIRWKKVFSKTESSFLPKHMQIERWRKCSKNMQLKKNTCYWKSKSLKMSYNIQNKYQRKMLLTSQISNQIIWQKIGRYSC